MSGSLWALVLAVGTLVPEAPPRQIEEDTPLPPPPRATVEIPESRVDRLNPPPGPGQHVAKLAVDLPKRIYGGLQVKQKTTGQVRMRVGVWVAGKGLRLRFYL